MSETATRLPADPPCRRPLRGALARSLGLVARIHTMRRLGLAEDVLDAARLLMTSPELRDALNEPAVRALFRQPSTAQELAMILRLAARSAAQGAPPSTLH